MAYFEFPHTRTYDSDLGWLIKAYKALTDFINSTIGAWEDIPNDVKELQEAVANIQKTLEDIENGKYSELYKNALISYLKEYLTPIIQKQVADIVKYVIFGLNTEGYFIAYIPDSWDFIQFDTIMDTTSDLWGHLVLRW